MSLVGDAAEKLAITTSWTNPQVCRTARTVDWHELATKDDLAGLAAIITPIYFALFSGAG